MPKAIGNQNTNINGRLPAAASQKRRPTRPQLPPLVYCSISKHKEPVVKPSQNRKPTSQPRKNSSQPKFRPRISATTKAMTPTVSDGARHRPMMVGGA